MSVVALAALLTAAPAAFSKPVSLHRVTPRSVMLDCELGAPDDLSVTLTGPGGSVVTAASKRSTHHRLTVGGLRPGSSYDYACRAGAAVARGTFWTAPPEGAAAPFTFAVLGDTRDHGQWASVAAAVAREKPRFVLDTGDSSSTDDEASWRDFFEAGRALFGGAPLFATRGNHDRVDLFARFKPSPDGPGPSLYAFTYGNARFVAFDSNAPDDAAQKAFVAQALSTRGPGPLFVFQHHPLFSCGGHGSSTGLQKAFRGIFETAHVAVDFAGHDHDLIEWQPVAGVRYVVSGGGGSLTYPLSGCEGQPFARQSFGFTLVDVDGSDVTMRFLDGQGIEIHRSGPLQSTTK
jgi:hypothetical protein